MSVNYFFKLLFISSTAMVLSSCDHTDKVCELEPEYSNQKVINKGYELVNKDNLGYKKGENLPFTGLEIERYESCQIGILATYENGAVVKLEEWYENGEKQSETNFKMKGDVIQNAGTWKYWYKDGTQESQTNWKDDLKHGLDNAWHESGTKAYEVNYINGQKQGVETRWHESGAMNTQVKYMNGKPTGMVKVWDEEGELLEERNLN